MYEWDWADRLVKVSSNNVVLLQNWYDAKSRRIAKQEIVGGSTNKWLYVYDGWDIVAVMDGTGTLQETFTRGVGLAGDIGPLVAVTHHEGANAGTYYTHGNHRGDVVLVRSGTSTSGTYSYSAFGELSAQTGTDLCRFKFSSKERENSCVLSYYGYRFYSPELTRWLSRDPIQEGGGLNLYGFCYGNPVCMTDPLGLRGSIHPVKFAACMALCMFSGITDLGDLQDLLGEWSPPPFATVGAGFLGIWQIATGPAHTRAQKAAQKIARKQLKRIALKFGIRGGWKAAAKLMPGIGWGLIGIDAAICAARCADEDWVRCE